MFKTKVYRFAAASFVIVITLSLVRGYIGVRDWIPIFLMTVLSFLFYPRAFLNKETLFLAFYLIMLVVFWKLGHSQVNPRWIVIQIFTPLVCISMINVFLFNQDMYGLRIVTFIGLLIILITSVLTILITLKNPMAVRDMVRFSVENNTNAIIKYQRQGIASYGLVHSLPFLYPILVYYVKAGKKVLAKGCALVMIFICTTMIIKSNFAASLVLSVAGAALAFLWSKNKFINIYLCLLIALCCALFMNDKVVVSGLQTIQPYLQENKKLNKKINDAVQSIKRGRAEGDFQRVDTAEKSWNSFVGSPVIGNFKEKSAGGHSFFIDRLAWFGIIGSFPLFLFLFFSLSKIFVLCENHKKIYYFIAVGSFVVLTIFKNVGGIEPFLYLFVFLPGLSFQMAKDNFQ